MYDNCITCYHGLWMWNVIAQVWNKQSRTNESVGIPVWGSGLVIETLQSDVQMTVHRDIFL